MLDRPNSAPLSRIGKPVRDLITINENIQSALIKGERLTPDERDLVRICSVELLSRALEKGVGLGRAHGVEESHSQGVK